MNDPLPHYPWRTLGVLVIATTLTAPLVIPYVLGLEATAVNPLADRLPDSIAILVALVVARNLVILGIAAWLGLLIGRRIGLGAPYLENRLDGAAPPPEPLSSIVRPALFWAGATALLAFVVDAFFFYGLGVEVPAPEIHARIDVALWRSGLASFAAPFSEEIFDRLLLLSLIAWLSMKLFRARGEGPRRTAALWVANVATALFFAWYHISNESLFIDPVPSLVALRTMLIITPVGLALGWLYWRRGLEAAILSHFAIDIIVHVIRPLVGP